MKKIRLIGPCANASFSIEAAVIIPLSMIMLAAAVFSGFYLHDVVKMGSVCTELSIENAEKAKSNDGNDEFFYTEKDNNGLVSAKDPRIYMEEKKEGLKVEYDACFHVPIGIVSTIVGQETNVIDIKREISGIDARAEVLKYKALLDGAENIGLIKEAE